MFSFYYSYMKILHILLITIVCWHWSLVYTSVIKLSADCASTYTCPPQLQPGGHHQDRGRLQQGRLELHSCQGKVVFSRANWNSTAVMVRLSSAWQNGT